MLYSFGLFIWFIHMFSNIVDSLIVKMVQKNIFINNSQFHFDFSELGETSANGIKFFGLWKFSLRNKKLIF